MVDGYVYVRHDRCDTVSINTLGQVVEQLKANIPSNVVLPLGISRYDSRAALLYQSKRRGHNRLSLALSENGVDFQESPDAPVIMTGRTETEDIRTSHDLRFATIFREKLLLYNRGSKLVMARQSYDDDFGIALWERLPARLPRATSGVIVDEYKAAGQYVLYWASHGINVALSKDLRTWHSPPRPLVSGRAGYFDAARLEVVAADAIPEGILLVYTSSAYHGHKQQLSVGAVLCARDNPAKMLWRSEVPLWQATVPRSRQLRVIGSLRRGGELCIYLTDKAGKLLLVELLHPFSEERVAARAKLALDRHPANPLLTPEGGGEWEHAGTFNPAAVVHDGKIHMFYRALGADGISRVGYAVSDDGVLFDRQPTPAYDHGPGFTPPAEQKTLTYNPDRFASGGGWGGCEDPRAVIIDDQLYMSFGIFESWQSMRMAVTTLPLPDLGARLWAWAQPMVLSPKGETHKNWMLFPEKIDGKFAILHALTPRISIEYVARLEDAHETPIQSNNQRSGRKGAWDGFVRGASAPPIKTEAGWLLLYHGMDPSVPAVGYKVGAMLLDLNDPTKVLHRTSRPILVPEQWYENEGKPGVVYASGTVLWGDDLIVYYGGGDRHICMAKTNLVQFVQELQHNETPQLTSVETRIQA